MQLLKESEHAIIVEIVGGTCILSKRPPKQYKKQFVVGVRVDAFSGACVPIYSGSHFGKRVLKYFGNFIKPYEQVSG